jgi:hypothetical protein
LSKHIHSNNSFKLDEEENELPFQSLSENWKLESYKYYKLIQPERVRLISITEAHKVVLHDNQTSIEKLLKDKFSNKKEGSIDSDLLAVDSRLLIDGEGYDYYDDDEVIEEEEEEEIEEGESDEEEANLCLSVYYKWIYNILHQMERSRFLNDSNKIVPFSCWFE